LIIRKKNGLDNSIVNSNFKIYINKFRRMG